MARAHSGGVAAGQLGSLYTLGAAGSLTDGQLLQRFLSRDDPTAAEAAFTELVDRHGPMVLAVCRRELGDPHDAHDAFQATFLVLVTKAGTIRHRESVGGWLFGIARRVSARARLEGARRRRHLERFGTERNLSDDGTPPPAMPMDPDVDYAPLIDEVHRLPERFRAPVVLHYFEGLSAEATAQRLGCARGTVLSRLARARHRLKGRLERRGFSPAILIPIGEGFARWLTTEPVPGWLSQATARAAGSLGLAGAAIESVVPARVAGLSRRVARTLALARAGAVGALILLAAAGVSIGLAATLQTADEPRGRSAMQGPSAGVAKLPSPRADAKPGADPLVLRGQVLDPDGKPAVGATVALSFPGPLTDGELRRLGSTGPDGRFEVAVPRAGLKPATTPSGGYLPPPVIAAFAPGLGPDWTSVDPSGAYGPIVLRLRRDDVPVEGRIISLEGRPLAGLSVRVAYIVEYPPGLMAKLRENAGKMNPAIWGEMRSAFFPGEEGAVRATATDPDGRFRIAGIGRDRVALVLIEGDSIEQSFAMITTTDDRTYRPVLLPADGSGQRRIEGPRFELTVAPGRAIEGIVRDCDTDQPIAGARVLSWAGKMTTTDDRGRFRLPSQSRGRQFQVDVTVSDRPYIRSARVMNFTRDSGGAQMNFALKRGVWLEGKVVDSATRKPLRATITYYPLHDNPHVKDCPEATFFNNNVSDETEFRTGPDGRFRAAALPGAGVLAVRVIEPGYVYGRRLDDRAAGKVLHVGFVFYQSSFHTIIPIDVPAGGDAAVPDIAVAPGRTQHIEIVDADGRPVVGTRAFCFQEASLNGAPVAGNRLTFTHANPGKAEAIVIVHEGRSLGAKIELKGDELDPVRVVLRPAGAVTGRLVDDDGRPRAGVHLAIHHYMMSRGTESSTERFEPLTTGPDGRFRIKHLVPGVSYSLQPIKPNERNISLRSEGYLKAPRWTVQAGEAQDWGDVRVKAYGP